MKTGVENQKQSVFIDRYAVFNWKMNPATLAESDDIFDALKKASAKMRKTLSVVCPPSVFLDHLAWDYKGKRIAFGAQDGFHEEKGSWTGQVSYNQLKHVGANWAIINHSERKKLGEQKENGRRKMDACLKLGMNIVLCIGEDARDTQGTHFKFIEEEIRYFLRGLEDADREKVIIAYEPIWAIGASHSASSHDVHEMCLYIRKILTLLYGSDVARVFPLLYGGSVDDTNASHLLDNGQLSGFLIGRASLDPSQFEAILTALDKAVIPHGVSSE